MREARKDQFAAIVIVLMLLLLTSIALINLNKFVGPTSTNFGSGGIGIPNRSSPSTGILLVQVDLNFTLLTASYSYPSGGVSLPLGIPSEGSITEAMRGVFVSITNVATGSTVFSNLTNSIGQVVVNLPAAVYDVDFQDWRLNYSSVTVDLYTGQVTRVQSNLTATGFIVQKFNVIDPYSTNWALPWEQLYLQVPNLTTVPVTGSSTFIQTSDTPLFTTLMNGNLTDLTPVSVVGSIVNQNSEWVDVNAGLPISLQSINLLQLLSISTSFDVST